MNALPAVGAGGRVPRHAAGAAVGRSHQRVDLHLLGDRLPAATRELAVAACCERTDGPCWSSHIGSAATPGHGRRSRAGHTFTG